VAHAHITEFDSGDDRSTTNYDAFMERIDAGGQPAGLIYNCAGFDDNGVFRMFETWESSEHRQRFVKERLEPLLAEGPVDPTRSDPPTREYGYDLHYTSR
jgi:hypothetical protein